MAPPDEAEQPAPQGEQPKRKAARRRRRRRKPASATGGTTQQRDQASTQTKGREQGAQRAKGQATKGTQTKKGAKARGGKKRRGASPRRPKIPTTREVSSGGVVYRRTDDGIEVVLASRRTRRGQLAWGLAKGGIETGESREVAAIREVREETGLTAEIEADLGDTKYMYVWDDIRIRKTVHFFLMRYTGGDVEDRDDEMEEIRWFPMERAIKRAAYRGERDMLVKASELLR
ncbi:MAG: NUDIX hydrolase [Actinomycetota bacterium]|nr:NUDIX hydrolase [Actinomycetota bacterium]